MTYDGVGYTCKIEGNMDAALYTNILEDELQQSIEYFEMDRTKVIFQQDNDRKHTSKKVSEWFKNHSIQLLDWRAQSPDLNPIEHLWRYLKQKLNEYEEPPKGMQELWERVEQQWEAIPQDICIRLIESITRRIAAVLKAKGKYIKY